MEHDPDWHVPPSIVQSWHDAPPLPQRMSSLPDWHVPEGSQQPLHDA